jgi:hypothetical protein
MDPVEIRLKNVLKEDNRWKLGQRTQYRKYLEKDDKILFYLAGSNFGFFFASGILDSSFLKTEDEFTGVVNLDNLVIYPTTLFLKTIIKNLDIFNNNPKWTLKFANGIVGITRRDHLIILRKMKKINLNK